MRIYLKKFSFIPVSLLVVLMLAFLLRLTAAAISVQP